MSALFKLNMNIDKQLYQNIIFKLPINVPLTIDGKKYNSIDDTNIPEHSFLSLPELDNLIKASGWNVKTKFSYKYKVIYMDDLTPFKSVFPEGMSIVPTKEELDYINNRTAYRSNIMNFLSSEARNQYLYIQSLNPYLQTCKSYRLKLKPDTNECIDDNNNVVQVPSPSYDKIKDYKITLSDFLDKYGNQSMTYAQPILDCHLPSDSSDVSEAICDFKRKPSIDIKPEYCQYKNSQDITLFKHRVVDGLGECYQSREVQIFSNLLGLT